MSSSIENLMKTAFSITCSRATQIYVHTLINYYPALRNKLCIIKTKVVKFHVVHRKYTSSVLCLPTPIFSHRGQFRAHIGRAQQDSGRLSWGLATDVPVKFSQEVIVEDAFQRCVETSNCWPNFNVSTLTS